MTSVPSFQAILFYVFSTYVTAASVAQIIRMNDRKTVNDGFKMMLKKAVVTPFKVLSGKCMEGRKKTVKSFSDDS
jgi:hypothetical protein